MFNVKKGRLSFDISSSTKGIQISAAPNMTGYTPLICALVNTEFTILQGYLIRQFLDEYDVAEQTLIEYYTHRGFTISFPPAISTTTAMDPQAL